MLVYRIVLCTCIYCAGKVQVCIFTAVIYVVTIGYLRVSFMCKTEMITTLKWSRPM
jgi:hypothetical protein